MDPIIIGLILWLISSPVFTFLWLKGRQNARRVSQENTALKEKYSPITSQEDEVNRLLNEAASLNEKIQTIKKDYLDKKKTFDLLEKQIAIYDERLSFSELGMYEPHFEFSDSEEFKRQITKVRDAQKQMVSMKTAAVCDKGWTVDGSASKGVSMINRQTRLTLRAFNNECEAAIANVRWNNIVAMEKRAVAASIAINKENTSMNLNITDKYVSLKIEELRLTHEYREQLKREKEERAEMARAEREEKKLLAQAEAAEREEAKYQALLDKVKKEAGSDTNTARIKELEAALAAAHAVSERARAMAEMTKSGYVYIISNIGSFGEDVVKIGLTRRLDPDDRVRELGDASVPFSFDTHAMIYSDEAPALETALHREFSTRRINTSNFRKEFFKVSLEEVEDAVSRLAPNAGFFKDREAQEWHETLTRRNETLQKIHMTKNEFLPAEL